MTSDQIAWVAGIVEGEGCIDRNQNKYIRLRVQMVDEDVIRKLHATTGVGTISTDDRNHRRNPLWQTTFSWSVCKQTDVKYLLLKLRPWMSHRRGSKIDQLLGL